MPNAPLYEDILEGPKTGYSEWIQAKDKFRIRVAFWPKEDAIGTVLIFPGRNEYIEKYGRTSKKIWELGYSSLVVDWRGQGLSDRYFKNRLIGHVNEFADYQLDVEAIAKFAELKSLPKPWYLLAHSMGGTIGLRAIHNGLAVKKVVFSAPMWEIRMNLNYLKNNLMQIYGRNSYFAYKILKLENNFVPGVDQIPYLKTAEFKNNSLTTDRDYFQFLKNQILLYPELALAGPSIKWLSTALLECQKLRKLTPPVIPCLTFSSPNDRIVSNSAIKKVLSNWNNSKHLEIGNAEHEVLMEDFDLLQLLYSVIRNFLT